MHKNTLLEVLSNNGVSPFDMLIQNYAMLTILTKMLLDNGLITVSQFDSVVKCEGCAEVLRDSYFRNFEDGLHESHQSN